MNRIDVSCEVAGTIWKSVATVGAELAEGEVILVVESMKMEIPVEAPCAGRLVELRVAEQDPVAEDQIVAVIERA